MGANIVEIILKATDKASKAFASAGRGAGEYSSSIKGLMKDLGLATLATAALKKSLDFGKESVLLAARVDTLGAVTEVMGNTAGYTASEVDKLEKSIQEQGITTEASRQALAQMMRAEIDLAKATDLARLAQDAAVISGDNSSQAFEQLTQIIGTGNTVMARRMGLLVDFEGAYKRLADQLGKSTDDLTELEKVQARTSEVMEQGRTIAGSYSAAMETGGKKLSSYTRHLDELKLALGAGFQDAFTGGIDVLTEFTDALGGAISAENQIKDAVKGGYITQEQANALIGISTWTQQEFADTLEIVNAKIEAQDSLTRGADQAMLSYSNNVGLVISPLEALTGASERYGDRQAEATAKAQAGADAQREMARQTEAAQAAAEAAAGAMQNYFSLFDDPDPVTVADNLTGQLSDHLVDAASGAAAAGEDIGPWIDALKEYDPAAAGALEQSYALTGTLGTLDEALLSGKISSEDYAGALDALTLGIEGGVDPMAAMETQLDKLGLQVDSNKDGVDDFRQSLADLVAGSPYTVEIKTVYTQSGSPGGGGSGSGTYTPAVGGSKLPRRASGGPVYSDMPYMVGERGPEMFVPRSSGRIIPNNQIGGDTITIINNDERAAAITTNLLLIKKRERARAYT